ncbi:type IIL restriction-modification enzyme MmeI [Mucilaginibacter terrae]|uniref:type IIL restriction-modification enzyme MmeI n=1 Tax=Mucilaginibacter terrae TaxID=1955052 RepID=UPI00363978BF
MKSWPSSVIGNPFPLKANAKKSFQGSIVLGKGFIITSKEASALITKDPRNKNVLFPYLNGDDLNNDPKQKPSRWVINFFDWTEEEARTYPQCFEIVEQLVKPERMLQNDKGGKEKWWQFLRPRSELYETISQLDQAMVVSLVSKYSAFEFAPNNIVYMHKLGVIVLNDFRSFAILSSTLHNIWCWKNSSTLGAGTLNYSTTACFETFPFPVSKLPNDLSSCGEEYYTLRQSIMKILQIGLTKLYNLFHDKLYDGDAAISIKELRDLHVKIDLAVLNSYGWSDILPRHDFYELEYLPEKDRIRFTLHPEARKEVLLRILELNHSLYVVDQRSGNSIRKSSINQETFPTLFDHS